MKALSCIAREIADAVRFVNCRGVLSLSLALFLWCRAISAKDEDKDEEGEGEYLVNPPRNLQNE
jgi:hypothetical protein